MDGTANGNEVWHTAERRKRPCVRPATVQTGSCSSGGVWRTAKWRKRTFYGRNGGPVDWKGCCIPQNGGNGLVLERYGRNRGPIHREATDWVGKHRVHQEPTGLDGTADGNEAWRTAERRKRSCVRPATVQTGSCSLGGVWHTAKQRNRTSYGRNGVLLIGRSVAYRKTEEADLCWSATVEMGVLFIGGVAYCKTRLHGLLFISTVNLL